MDKYNHTTLEPRWQSFWDEIGLFRAEKREGRPKYYCLTMYPYPSGTLHMGHVINYTIGDAMVRYHIMKGENVLSPMGWDSFGLPAENAAIREQVDPAEYTARNIAKMKEQMGRAGWGYDWEREVATSHPGYYRWTQWIFLQLFQNDLAFKKDASVNWCPSCNTVLANEQVIKGDFCERCNSDIEQRQLNQWFFKMSAYAERLLNNHELLRGRWPERVLKMQEEWVGRSTGVDIDFRVDGTDEVFPIFTTRPDTLFGVTFMAISPHHPRIPELMAGRDNENEVMDVVGDLKKQTISVRNVEEVKKVGIDTGVKIVNPVNGDRVALWVANFVLMEYGTGMIMAVPGHDQRDFEFAREYGIPVKVVIQPPGEELDADRMEAAYVEEGIMANSGQFDGTPSGEAIEAIADFLEQEGQGRRTVHYKLKDWLISRQRYWGAPIPVVYCDECGTVPVAESDLPVLLPANVEFKPTGESPLKECFEFVNAECPTCGGEAQRETDTMDTFVDSSWYFLRYLSPRDEGQPFDKEQMDYWMPVDQYVGGVEHATMHLVYFRFLMMALKDLGHIAFEEPAQHLFCQGMVCKVAHYCQECKWVAEKDVDLEKGECRKCGGPVTSDMSKISKTKLNTVSPDEIIDEFGADTMRLNILSDNPPDQEQVWSDDAVKGAYKFINRLYALAAEHLDAVNSPESREPGELSDADRDVLRKVHQTIGKVTDCIEKNLHFNTAIASVFELVNMFRNAPDLSPYVKREATRSVVLLLAPITPHVCEELWHCIGGEGSVFQQSWPVADTELAAEETVDIILQVNGKVRSRVAMSVSAGKDELEQAALNDEKIQALVEGRDVKKIIVVPGRLVNIVI